MQIDRKCSTFTFEYFDPNHTDVWIFFSSVTLTLTRLVVFVLGKNSLSCRIHTVAYMRLRNYYIYRVCIRVEHFHNNPVDTYNTPFCWPLGTVHWTHKLLAPNTDFCTPCQHRTSCSSRNHCPCRMNISCTRCSVPPGTRLDTHKRPSGRLRDTESFFRTARLTYRRDFCIFRSNKTDRRNNPHWNGNRQRILRLSICDPMKMEFIND